MASVDEWTGGAGADVAFEVSGSAGGVTTATHALGVRGRLVMVAIHSTPREVDLFRVFWRELTVIGARVYERQDFETAVRLVSTGDIPVRASDLPRRTDRRSVRGVRRLGTGRRYEDPG